MDVFREYYRRVAGLADDRLARLGAVHWLLSGSNSVRRSGRSLLMALSFVREASLAPGDWVKVWDHHDSGRVGKRMMIHLIENLFPTGIESGEGAVMVREGWPRNRLDGTSRDNPDQARRMVLDDVKTAAIAALRLGASIDDVKEAVKEALVQCVMEA